MANYPDFILSYNARVLAAGGCHKLQSQERVSHGSGQAAAAALVTTESGATRAGGHSVGLTPLHSILPPSGQQIYRGPQQTSEAIQVSVL